MNIQKEINKIVALFGNIFFLIRIILNKHFFWTQHNENIRMTNEKQYKTLKFNLKSCNIKLIILLEKHKEN